MARCFRALFMLTTFAFAFAPAAAIAAEPAVTPCSLLSAAEIQAALGKPVQPGKLKTQANPAAGSDCSWMVGDIGSFNFLIKPLSSSETPERIKAEFARRKMAPLDLPKLGDCSFFTSPGYGMVQLHTIKGARYLLFTTLVPGVNEPALRAAAEKLMRAVLAKIK